MMRERPVPAATRRAQARASDPAVSAWVSANAGSGKTHVLAQRVIRLLLSGVPPAKILCLTFTKAAAANMAARVFEKLAEWTGLQDDALESEIATMSEAPPSGADLVLARRLFARTVETPGGLKIQTIHAFCERLLHLFPFEANVAARFEVIEDLRQADLLKAARSAALASAVSGTSPELAEALRIVTAETTGVTFGVLMAEMVALRGPIVALVRQHGIDGVGRALARQLGLDPGEDVQSIERAILEEGIPSSEWGEISRTLARAGSVNGTAGRLAEAALAPKGEARLDAYLRVFLVRKTLEPRADSYLPNVLRRSLPTLCMRLDEERERLVPLVDRRRAALTVRRTRALLALGDAVLSAYARLKADQGVLDFDDLIAKTLSLVTRSDAAWVLYKLDAGIDHILLDEAQDTSSEQWMVLQRLAADLMAGEGARGVARTLFAVGDEKQSIFSFQGAAPEMFDRMRRYFEGRIRESAPSRGEAGAKFRHLPLHLSFRSVPAVLSAVDDVFSLAENFSGLSFD
ncbi:MAG: UvrD-helicase domain-containing protein, partial [Methylobacteriaceae bacterium]|nr:UvrD-helicase domain-containing protein [Methylobacteriaceae bacterium]